jgi:hypothetical protein
VILQKAVAEKDLLDCLVLEAVLEAAGRRSLQKVGGQQNLREAGCQDL